MIEYTPISNMGLKRFIFFDNSRLDTKSPIDDEAYKKCVKIMSEAACSVYCYKKCGHN